jgi:hypothetical protein
MPRKFGSSVAARFLAAVPQDSPQWRSLREHAEKVENARKVRESRLPGYSVSPHYPTLHGREGS